VIRKAICFGCFAVGLILASASMASAARATAPRLLPRETFFYARVADVPQSIERFKETALGRIANDPQMRPLVSDIYATIKDALAQVQERIGMSLDELLAIPQGEIAFGGFRLEGQARPGMAFIIDCGQNIASARKLFGKLKEIGEASGDVRIVEETVAGTKVTVFAGGGDGPQVHLFEKDSTFVLCPDLESARAVITNWLGREGDAFENNAKFAAVMRACSPGRDEEPQLTWFADPLAFADAVAQENVGARVGLAMLPALGLDGLNALGGSITMAAGEYDMITHMHVLLALPRAGVLAAIGLDSGDLTPQKWVPADVAGYTTIYWDFQKTYREVEKLIDSFRGEGATADWSKLFIADRIGVDPIDDVLPKLTGRVTLISQILKPITVTSAAQLLAIEVHDEKEFQATLEKVVERVGQLSDRFLPEKTSIAGVTYYRVKVPAPPNHREGDPLPEPAFGVVHGCLMLTDRETMLKNIITSSLSSSLADELDYKLIANKATRAAGAAQPGLLSFNRPEEGLRYLYDLASAEQTRKRLAEAGEENQFFRSLGGVLDRNPLPPFSTLAKYIAPAGAAMINDDTGIHYVSFSLRRK
jgi:hypothetical protein